MTEQLRQLGVKARIVTTSFWGEELLSSLPALAGGDLIDVHPYGNTMATPMSCKKIPSMQPTSWTGSPRLK
jgi:hypothetical protein